MVERASQLPTEPFTAERTWEVEGIPVLSATVSLPEPVPAADRVSRRIRRYYRLQCRAFLRYCEHWLLPQAEIEYHAALAASTPMPQFQAALGYQITYDDAGIWSLYTQSREVTLPGQTLLQRHGDTWDLRTGYPAALSDFFPRRSGWRKRLLAFAEADIQRQEAAGTARYRDGWRRELRRRFDPMNFYLSAQGLVFFYPMYAIAPAIEGIPTFTVPLDACGIQWSVPHAGPDGQEEGPPNTP